jgi:aldehyde dehydrogenase (NAD+)
VAGDALVRHPGIGRISFTGSTETARVISRAAAAPLTPLHFELGGKSPNIVFADADLEAAAAGLSVNAIFTGNAGQSCIAGSRILIERKIYDEMVERIGDHARAVKVGDPFDDTTTMGPLISTEQLDRVRGYLASGPSEGAGTAFGGRTGADLFEAGSAHAGGYYVEPTLFTTTDNSLTVCQEEIFGPVAVAIPFEDEADAVRIGNDSSYGLAAGVWTRDLNRAHRMIRDLWAGSVWVNTYRRIHWALPFGGFKDSGYGKDSGMEAILENTQIKTAWIEL